MSISEETINFYKILLGADFATPASRRLTPRSVADLYMPNEGHPSIIGTAQLFRHPKQRTTMYRKLHGHALPKKKSSNLVVINKVNVIKGPMNDRRTWNYPYTYKGPEDVPETLGEMTQADIYV